MIWPITVSAPCRMVGPRMKYQLKVTMPTMIINPSRTMRVRVPAGRAWEQHKGIRTQEACIGPGGEKHGQVCDVLVVGPEGLANDIAQDTQAQQQGNPSLRPLRRCRT